MRTRGYALAAVLFLLVAGCSKMHDERTVQVAPGDEKTLTIDAPRRDQAVNVEFNSPGAPVNV